MDTLAYFHLASSYEESVAIESVSVEIPVSGVQEFKGNLFASSGWLRFIAALAVLAILGATNAAMALQKGDQGGDVARLQHRLQQLGYFKAHVTGYYGSITKNAVIAYQRDHRLPVIGIAGPRTHAALGLLDDCYDYRPVYHPRPKSRHRPGKYHPTSHRPSHANTGHHGSQVAAVQKRLASLGYFHAKATGYYGPITKAAVKSFQRDHGLKQDGIVGPRTRSALFPT